MFLTAHFILLTSYPIPTFSGNLKLNIFIQRIKFFIQSLRLTAKCEHACNCILL